jgi:hypothetical protein
LLGLHAATGGGVALITLSDDVVLSATKTHSKNNTNVTATEKLSLLSQVMVGMTQQRLL